MYNLLIVDDEMIIADGLFTMFESENSEQLQVYRAYSAMDGLEIAGERRIDILLTDINMPEVDGFGLYEKMTALWPSCRVIFLTGFESFDYAYKAIQYKNVRYVIKAEGVGKVQTVVHEVMGELEAGFKEMIPTVVELEKESKERLIKEIVLSYFNGEITLEEFKSQKLESVGFGLDITRDIYVVGTQVSQGTDRVPTSGEQMQFAFKINALLKNHLPEQFDIFPLPMSKALFWLVQPDNSRSGELQKYLMNLLDLFQVHLEQSMDVPSLIVVSKAKRFEMLPGLFNRFYDMLKMQLLMEGSQMTYEELQRLVHQKESDEFGEIRTEDFPGRRQKLTAALEHQNRSAFFMELEPVLEEIRHIKSRHNIHAKEIYLTLSVTYLNYINQTGLYEKLPFELALSPLTNMEEYATWEERADYLYRLGEAIFKVSERTNLCEVAELIGRVEKIVDENIENGINIAMVAEKVFFNTYYLSKLYKNAKGINLSEYINHRKMQRARDLLADPGLKVQKIGERLGYSSPANFIRSFKSCYGITPNEYRRNILSDGMG